MFGAGPLPPGKFEFIQPGRRGKSEEPWLLTAHME